MNISGISAYVGAGALSHYDKLNQGFGVYDYSNQFRPTKADPIEDMSGSQIKLSVNQALTDMRQDKELEEFQIFVPSGATPEESYQENWRRPVENFVL